MSWTPLFRESHSPKLREEFDRLSAELSQGTAGRQAAAQADSTAASVAALVVDFNLLLAKLRAAKVIAE